MHSHGARRHQVLKRVAVYTLMTLTVGIIATTLVFVMLGYRFNRTTGVIQQGGLVQFDTEPNGAQIHVGTIELARQTPTKITLNPGTYTISMQRQNYEPWQKNVSVVAGRVLRLTYARLIPTQLSTTSVAHFDTLADMTTRTGQEKIALLSSSKKAVITEVDTSKDPVVTTTVTIPAEAYHGGKNQRFNLADFSRDDKHIVVSHTYDNKKEWLYVDMENPEKTINLTTLFGITPTKILFDNRSNDGMYVLTDDGDVRFINLSNKTMSSILIPNAADISLQGTRALWYTTKPQKGAASVGYLTLGSSQPRSVTTYQTKLPVFVNAGDYFGDTYLSTVVGTKLTIDRVDHFPASGSQSTFSTTRYADVALDSVATRLTIYAGGRFIAVEHAKSQDVYDVELKNLASIPLVGVKSTKTTPPLWIDGYYFTDDAGGALRLYEYDGSNQHVIASVVPGFQALLSSDGKYLYSVSKSKTGYELQRTQLILQ